MQPSIHGVRLKALNGKCLTIANDSSADGAGVVLGGCGDFTPRTSWQVFEQYCGTCASNYAEAWWDGRNPKYPNYSNDCTNFVSQAVAQGGLFMEGGWYYFGGGNQSESWASVPANNNWFLTPGVGSVAATYEPPPAYHPSYTPLVRGDLLYYGPLNQALGHATILTGWGSYDYVNYHTNDVQHNKWDLPNGANYLTTRIVAVHIDPNAPLNRLYH